MKLVELKNGKYTVQVKQTFWDRLWGNEPKYFDLINQKFKWDINNEHFRDCCASKEVCEAFIDSRSIISENY